MKQTPIALGIACLTLFGSCKKTSAPQEDPTVINQEEKALVAAAGFNSGWFEKTADGNYLIEGDILLTRSQLTELAATTPANNFIIAREEHYRTTNLVTAPKGSIRTITVSLGSGFPAYYSAGLDQALAHYNN